MDARRFDNLTRALAARASRRFLLRSVLGLGGGAAIAGSLDQEANARDLRTRNTLTTSPPAGCPGGAQYCGGHCCTDDQTCCNGSCCSGSCANGVCCPPGTTNCDSHCCDGGSVCCGSICCSSADLCSAGGARCCDAGTTVCGEECCSSGQECCDGECCNGTCYGEELCCPAGRETCGSDILTCCEEGVRCCGGECCAGLCSEDGAACCSAETTTLCGGKCCAGSCAADGVTCCVRGVSEPCGEGCCEGTCGSDGMTCCPTGLDLSCGDACCDSATQECCTDEAGAEHCIDTGECCRDEQCSGDGACAGHCDPTTHSCIFPGADVQCGEDECREDGEAQVQHRCNGSGSCIGQDHQCGDYFCLNGSCLTMCTETEHCVSGICNDDGTCCSTANECLGEFCCEPDEQNPYIRCCPGPHECCECLFDSHTNIDGFCFDPSLGLHIACGEFIYATSHYACVGEKGVVKAYVCNDGKECPTPCCGGSENPVAGPGGTCCPDGEECSNGICVPAAQSRPCNADTVAIDCLEYEMCATEGDVNGNGHCCPSHRSYRNLLAEENGAPSPFISCCPSGQHNVPSEVPGGDPYCSDFYELGTTSVKSWSRR